MTENPITTFIETYRNSPSILAVLKELEVPYDSDGRLRILNKSTLAELAGVTYQVVHRTDLALFEKIPPSLLVFMVDHSNKYIDYPVLYSNWRKFVEAQHILAEKNKAWKDTRHWTVEDPEDVLSTSILTFRQWRERHFDSLMNFAKMVLINPTILANYESGQTKTLPVVLRKQFVKFGMKEELIKKVEKLVNK